MITLWLASAMILTIALAVAARTIEPLCGVIGKPARMVWAIAISTAVGGSVGLVAARGQPTRDHAVPPSVPVVAVAGRGPAVPGGGGDPRRGTFRLMPSATLASGHLTLPAVPVWLDTLLLRLWGAGSTLLLLVVSASVVRTVRRRRGWELATLDGVVVHVSDDVGPALVGIGKPRIVVPRWVFGMGAEEQRLVIAHEREHWRAGDPMLVAGATLAVICAPWNAALWYMLRRLRLAVEVDCDQRVMHRHPDVRRYCNVLLEVSEQALYHPILTTALARAKSDLRRRVEALVGSPSRLSSGRLASGIVMSGALVFLSCTVPTSSAPRLDPVASRAVDSQLETLLGRNSSADSLIAQLQDNQRALDTALRATPLLDSLFAATSPLDTVGALPARILRDSALYTALRRLLESLPDSAAGGVSDLLSTLDAHTASIHDAIARYFPDQLTGERQVASGLWFVVDANGAVVGSKRTVGQHAPSISADVVAQQFAGISAQSIDEIRILSGRTVGVPNDWLVWAVLRRETTAR